MSATVKPKALVERTDHPHIVKSADIFDGMPRMEGTRISVLQVTNWIASGLTPEYIVESFPPLTLAQIDDALAYAADHPDEMVEHRSRHTLRSVLKREDLIYVNGRLIPSFALKESEVPPGAEVYDWETLPEGKE